MRKTEVLFLLIFTLSSILYPLSSIQAAFADLGWGTDSGGVSNSVMFSKRMPGLFWLNPAASAFAVRPAFSAEYEDLYPGLTDGSQITRNIFYYSQRMNSSGFGGGMEILSLQGLYSERTGILNYSRAFANSWYSGMNFRLLQTHYGSGDYTDNAIESDGLTHGNADPLFLNHGFDKTAFTLDAGVSKIIKEFWYVSGAVSFLTSPDTSLGGGGKRKPTLSLGGAFEKTSATVGSTLRLEDGNYRLNTGFEQTVSNGNIKVRGGLAIGSDTLRLLSIGFGYMHRGHFVFDYAFIYPLAGLKSSGGRHRFSVSYMFGEPPQAAVEEEKGQGGTAPPSEVEQLFKQAQEAFAAGNWQDAISLCKRVLLYEADHEGALEILAKSVKEVKKLSQPFIDEGKYYAGKGKFDIAETKFKTAMTVNPVDEGIKQSHERIADIMEAVPSASRSSNKDRIIRMAVSAYLNEDAALALNAAVYASQIDSSKDGLKILKIIRKAYPGQYRQMKLIGGMNLVEQKLYTALKNIYNARYDLAIMECNDAVKLEPRNVLALTRLGSAYYALGNREKAVSVWKQALEIDPRNKDILEFLGLTPGRDIKSVYEAKQKKESGARTAAKKFYLYGNGALARKDYAKAAELFKKVLAIQSADPEVKSYRRKAKARLDAANAELSKRSEANTKQMKIYYGNGMSYYGTGKYEEAIAEFKKLLQLNPNHKASLKMIDLCRQKMKK